MKIIDNKKDYYDYVSGIWGIDPYVVYDRRGSESSQSILSNPNFAEALNKNILDTDNNPWNKVGRYWHPTPEEKDHPNNYFIRKHFHIIIEAGDKHFYINCYRIRKTKDSPIELQYELYDPVEEIKKRYHYGLGASGWLHDRMEQEIERCNKKWSNAPLAMSVQNMELYYGPKDIAHVDNPILKDLPITGLIPAEEIWQAIYDYLLKQKEPKIVDNRTDKEHIESAGFDTVTSFRKM